jgi:hypothetical protein
MNWHPAGNSHRVLAAVASLAMTGMLLVALQAQVPSVPRRDAALLVITSLPPTAPKPDVLAPLPSTKNVTTRRKLRQVANEAKRSWTSEPQREMALPIPYSILPESPINMPQSELPPQVAEQAEAPASTPLRISSDVIKAAIARSMSPSQRNAKASGRQLPTGSLSKAEALSAGVKSAGKNGCLAPNENGSLLSLPVIAHSALTGQCN